MAKQVQRNFKKNTVQNDIKSEQEEAESGISVSFYLSINQSNTYNIYRINSAIQATLIIYI